MLGCVWIRVPLVCVLVGALPFNVPGNESAIFRDATGIHVRRAGRLRLTPEDGEVCFSFAPSVCRSPFRFCVALDTSEAANGTAGAESRCPSDFVPGPEVVVEPRGVRTEHGQRVHFSHPDTPTADLCVGVQGTVVFGPKRTPVYFGTQPAPARLRNNPMEIEVLVVDRHCNVKVTRGIPFETPPFPPPTPVLHLTPPLTSEIALVSGATFVAIVIAMATLVLAALRDRRVTADAFIAVDVTPRKRLDVPTSPAHAPSKEKGSAKEPEIVFEESEESGKDAKTK